MGNYPEVFHVETKQRFYDEQRQILCNYKTALGKEEALRNVIRKYLDGGLLSAPFAESEPRAKYNKAILNSMGAEIKARTRPDDRILVGSAQWGYPSH